MATLPLETLLARAAESPLALAQLAAVLFNMGDKTRACESALKALKAAPDDPEVRSRVGVILSKDVPDWHFALVRDHARNAAYEDALRRAVTPQTRVLEIGTGTGILAMLAARAGAAQVVTCETVPAIAEVAREIVALNGFADRVRVVAKKSYDLDPESDMGGRADLLVSEIFGTRMVDEGVLPVIEHAARTLLRPGAKIIPARGIVRVALAHHDGLDRRRMATSEGFDLSPFNRLAAMHYLLPRVDEKLTLLSPPADLFDFDFQSGGPFPAATAARTLVSSGGTANGIAQWIALQMDDVGRYENEPTPGATSAWFVVFWPFAAPRDCPPGTEVSVFGSHDRLTLRIWA